ncbi:MAG: hypothetical protein KAY65_10875, partial [Planctomycetes bacterium]|nr:hypothetical protein [Planctomycetota bacterium]
TGWTNIYNKTNPTLFAAKVYDNKPPQTSRKNEPKTNPIQTQFPLPQTSPLAHSPKRQPKACRAFFPLAHKKQLTARRKQNSHPNDRTKTIKTSQSLECPI